MQELYNGGRQRDLVQGARGPGYVLYKNHGPQIP